MGISFYKFSNFPHSLEFDPLKLDINSNKSQKWFSVLKVDYEYELNNKFGLRYNISQSFKKMYLGLIPWGSITIKTYPNKGNYF